MVEVTLCKTIFRFEVEGRENLAMQDRIFKSRGVFLDEVYYPIAQGVALLAPIAAAQIVGCRLHPYRHEKGAFCRATSFEEIY